MIKQPHTKLCQTALRFYTLGRPNGEVAIHDCGSEYEKNLFIYDK